MKDKEVESSYSDDNSDSPKTGLVAGQSNSFELSGEAHTHTL